MGVAADGYSLYDDFFLSNTSDSIGVRTFKLILRIEAAGVGLFSLGVSSMVLSRS